MDPCTQINSIEVSDQNTNARLNPRQAFNNYKEAADNIEKNTKMSKQVHRFGTVSNIKGPSGNFMKRQMFNNNT